MHDLQAVVVSSVQQLKSSNADSEGAFHNLIEIDHAVVPYLISAFQAETDDAIRAVLVEIIWQHRQPETDKFLLEALEDSSPKVWKNALDGLVTLGSPEVATKLESIRKRVATKWPDRICWIDEALGQITESLKS